MTRQTEGRVIALALLLAGMLAGSVVGYRVGTERRQELADAYYDLGLEEGYRLTRAEWLESIQTLNAALPLCRGAK